MTKAHKVGIFLGLLLISFQVACGKGAKAGDPKFALGAWAGTIGDVHSPAYVTDFKVTGVSESGAVSGSCSLKNSSQTFNNCLLSGEFDPISGSFVFHLQIGLFDPISVLGLLYSDTMDGIVVSSGFSGEPFKAKRY